MNVSLRLFALSLFVLLPLEAAWSQEECFNRLPVDKISLEFRRADIRTTLRLLAQQYRINLLVTEEVLGTVTVDFFEVPLRSVFRVILASGKLQCVERDGVLRVSTMTLGSEEEQARFKAEQGRRKEEAETRKALIEAQREEFEFAATLARGPLREVTIQLSYADAEQVAKTLQGILGIPPQGFVPPPPPPPALYAPQPPVDIGQPPAAPPPAPPAASPEALAKGLTINFHKPTNTLFIRYYENDLERIVKLVKEKLDIALPQVQIAAQMVITSKNALNQLGIEWGGAVAGQPKGGPTLVGAGFTQPPQGTGTPAQGVSSQNTGLTLGTALPVDPATALPTGGNLVNLPVRALATTANPAFGLLFGIIGQKFNINLAIQALEIQGKARSLSEPKIVTVENTTASMSRGFEVPYVTQTAAGGTAISNVQFKDALLKLEVTPKVIREETETRIKMKVLVENNEPIFTRSLNGNPPLFKRRAEAEVIMRDGEKLVIGGVLLDKDETTNRQVPLLGRIPFLGWLFKSRESTSEAEELIVIITPTVLLPTTAAKR